MTATRGQIPSPLKALREQFEEWRSTRTRAGRTPEALWNEAIACAGQFGLYRTARAVGIDYNALKRRVVPAFDGMARSEGVPAVPAKPREQSFIEVLPPGGIPVSQCVLEVENPSGGKLRIHLRGGAVPDIARLARSFAGEGA